MFSFQCKPISFGSQYRRDVYSNAQCRGVVGSAFLFLAKAFVWNWLWNWNWHSFEVHLKLAQFWSSFEIGTVLKWHLIFCTGTLGRFFVSSYYYWLMLCIVEFIWCADMMDMVDMTDIEWMLLWTYLITLYFCCSYKLNNNIHSDHSMSLDMKYILWSCSSVESWSSAFSSFFPPNSTACLLLYKGFVYMHRIWHLSSVLVVAPLFFGGKGFINESAELPHLADFSSFKYYTSLLIRL